MKIHQHFSMAARKSQQPAIKKKEEKNSCPSQWLRLGINISTMHTFIYK